MPTNSRENAEKTPINGRENGDKMGAFLRLIKKYAFLREKFLEKRLIPYHWRTRVYRMTEKVAS